jgi:hypothetical protein
METRAKIIKPDQSGKKTRCDDCGIEYSKEDYILLYKSKKIVYFDLRIPEVTYVLCLCHDCLFKYVKSVSGGKESKLLLFDENKEFHFKFDPKDFNEKGK